MYITRNICINLELIELSYNLSDLLQHLIPELHFCYFTQFLQIKFIASKNLRSALNDFFSLKINAFDCPPVLPTPGAIPDCSVMCFSSRVQDFYTKNFTTPYHF